MSQLEDDFCTQPRGRTSRRDATAARRLRSTAASACTPGAGAAAAGRPPLRTPAFAVVTPGAGGAAAARPVLRASAAAFRAFSASGPGVGPPPFSGNDAAVKDFVQLYCGGRVRVVGETAPIPPLFPAGAPVHRTNGHAASVLAGAEVVRVLNRGGGGCGADSAAQLAGALQEHLVSASHAMHAIVCQSIVDNAEYYHYIFTPVSTPGACA